MATGGLATGGVSTGGVQATGGLTTGGLPTEGGSIGGITASGGSTRDASPDGTIRADAAPDSVDTAGKGETAGIADTNGAKPDTVVATGGSNGTTPIKVWIAGDSTVATCSSACPCGWGGQFDALFNANITVNNVAVAGRSIQTWLYQDAVSTTKGSDGECTLTSSTYNARWTNLLNTTTGMKAGDYLFIQFGINDGDTACPRHVGGALYQKYLGMMAQAAKDKGAQPVFLTPTSAISCSGSNAVATRGFLTETKTAGTTFGVPVIDLHQLSISLYNSLKLCPNNEDYSAGAVGNFFCADHTHFEAAGAAQIAKVVAQAVKDQKLGLAGYLL